MSVWEFMACIDGFQVANGTKKKKGAEPSKELLAELGLEDD